LSENGEPRTDNRFLFSLQLGTENLQLIFQRTADLSKGGSCFRMASCEVFVGDGQFKTWVSPQSASPALTEPNSITRLTDWLPFSTKMKKSVCVCV